MAKKHFFFKKMVFVGISGIVVNTLLEFVFSKVQGLPLSLFNKKRCPIRVLGAIVASVMNKLRRQKGSYLILIPLFHIKD